MRAGVTAVVAVALGVGLTGCGSDATTGESTTAETDTTSETASEAPTTSPQAAGPALTIDEYIAQNGIERTPVRKGDAGAPAITLPFAEGWEDMGEQTPPEAYQAMVFTGDPAAAADPPTVVATVSRLTGDVDPAKVLEYALTDVHNLPGYKGMDVGQPTDLAGFEGVLLGGFYTKDDAEQMIAQKSVVIPADDAIYLLNIRAEGPQDQQVPLIDATSTIDEQATIVP